MDTQTTISFNGHSSSSHRQNQSICAGNYTPYAQILRFRDYRQRLRGAVTVCTHIMPPLKLGVIIWTSHNQRQPIIILFRKTRRTETLVVPTVNRFVVGPNPELHYVDRPRSPTYPSSCPPPTTLQSLIQSSKLLSHSS